MSEKILCLNGDGSKWEVGLIQGNELEQGAYFKAENLDDLRYKVGIIIGQHEPSGIAIAMAGVIIGHKTVQVSPNIHWLDGIDLAQWVMDNWVIPCVISNDMEAAVAGEMAFGNLKGIKNALMFAFSAVLGSAIVIDGKVIINKNCAEAHLSGGAVRNFLKIIFAGREGVFGEDDPCAYLDKKAAAKVPWATNLYKQVGTDIGEFWSSILNVLPNTERIVYMGKFGIKGMPFMIKAIRKTMRNKLVLEHYRKIVSFPINDDTGGLIWETALEGKNALYGAAAIYERELPELPKYVDRV